MSEGDFDGSSLEEFLMYIIVSFLRKSRISFFYGFVLCKLYDSVITIDLQIFLVRDRYDVSGLAGVSISILDGAEKCV